MHPSIICAPLLVSVAISMFERYQLMKINAGIGLGAFGAWVSYLAYDYHYGLNLDTAAANSYAAAWGIFFVIIIWFFLWVGRFSNVYS